ncbi:hypothetical protein [Candidatus Poriferisodalis sp.]|uniref:hypothetical protein n=1 Tax=Candidatus Poriferisodalis sp. TaxID=3101277 RepID=UPI003AF935D6
MKCVVAVLGAVVIVISGCAAEPGPPHVDSLPATTTAIEPSTPTITEVDSQELADSGDNSPEPPITSSDEPLDLDTETAFHDAKADTTVPKDLSIPEVTAGERRSEEDPRAEPAAEEPVNEATQSWDIACASAWSLSALSPSVPFRGLVHAGARERESETFGPVLDIGFNYIHSRDQGTTHLCLEIPGSWYCQTSLGVFPNGLNLMITRDFEEGTVRSDWGSPPQWQPGPSEVVEWPGWPDPTFGRFLRYGNDTFELTEYANGFALEYQDIRREYFLGPWPPRHGNDDGLTFSNAVLSGSEYDNYGTFYFAGTDGERIAIEYSHYEPACHYQRDLYIISLIEGIVEPCISFYSGDDFRLAASDGAYEPIENIRLPPSGWLYEDPCTLFRPSVASARFASARFGGPNTDWHAFSELVFRSGE